MIVMQRTLIAYYAKVRRHVTAQQIGKGLDKSRARRAAATVLPYI